MSARDLPVPATARLPMSAESIRDHVNAIQRVMEAVMKPGVHYGKVPGTEKPTLFKPGAEVLCVAFHIDPSYEIQDLSTADCYRYRVRCIGRHQETGIKLSEGMGSASSNEEKYKWRRVINEEEWETTPEARRRVKYGKKKNGDTYKVRQVRAEPDDIDNTILKMACKRAQVAMTINATAASDIFAQDIEDLPDHLRTPDPEDTGGDDSGHQQQSSSLRPREKGEAKERTPDPKNDTPASEGQIRLIRSKATAAGMEEAALLKAFNLEKLEGISTTVGNDLLKHIAEA